MTNDKKFKLLNDGYGCWYTKTNNIHPANVTAVVERLLCHSGIKGAFHSNRKEIWIKFVDPKNIPDNRAAIEYAFSANTF